MDITFKSDIYSTFSNKVSTDKTIDIDRKNLYQHRIYSVKYEMTSIFFNHNKTELMQAWGEELIEKSVFNRECENINSSVDYVIYNIDQAFKTQEIEEFFYKIKKASDNYLEDMVSSPKINFPVASQRSFDQLLRYIPDISIYHNKPYIDKDTGFLGVMLRKDKKSKTVLNLLMDSNGEVHFSFITKKRGFVKISGRAHFNDDLNDSTEIRHLLRMINK